MSYRPLQKTFPLISEYEGDERVCSLEGHGLVNWEICIGQMPSFNNHLKNLKFDPKFQNSTQGFCYIKPAVSKCPKSYSERSIRWRNEVNGNQNNFDFTEDDSERYWPGGIWGPGSDIEMAICCKEMFEQPKMVSLVTDGEGKKKENEQQQAQKDLPIQNFFQSFGTKFLSKDKSKISDSVEKDFQQHLNLAHKVLKSRVRHLVKDKTVSEILDETNNYDDDGFFNYPGIDQMDWFGVEGEQIHERRISRSVWITFLDPLPLYDYYPDDPDDEKILPTYIQVEDPSRFEDEDYDDDYKNSNSVNSDYTFAILKFGEKCPKLYENSGDEAWYDFPTEDFNDFDYTGDGVAEKSEKGVKLFVCMYVTDDGVSDFWWSWLCKKMYVCKITVMSVLSAFECSKMSVWSAACVMSVICSEKCNLLNH